LWNDMVKSLLRSDIDVHRLPLKQTYAANEYTGQNSSSSNCRNQPCYPVLEWEVMNLGYACTGRTARWITAGVRQLS
jgi:hypothetical protein